MLKFHDILRYAKINYSIEKIFKLSYRLTQIIGCYMEFLNWLSCKFLGEKVGYDSHGNSYYKSSYLARVLRKEKRWIRYNGIPEFTKVPTSWHAWLHYQTNLMPQAEKRHTWQEDRQMNMTGTKQAYTPKHKGSKDKVMPHIWSPKTIKS